MAAAEGTDRHRSGTPSRCNLLATRSFRTSWGPLNNTAWDGCRERSGAACAMSASWLRHLTYCHTETSPLRRTLCSWRRQPTPISSPRWPPYQRRGAWQAPHSSGRGAPPPRGRHGDCFCTGRREGAPPAPSRTATSRSPAARVPAGGGRPCGEEASGAPARCVTCGPWGGRGQILPARRRSCGAGTSAAGPAQRGSRAALRIHCR
mmetsp:Transcript_43085/g.105344  ORF Transcript_43085/g.105344 Transcript_43085/m.105344 type:complete len:206 (+) Transcript_43085:487-1104(+)